MAYQFNPPPGWPTPPQGWSPPEGWEPDASWPTPPQDWQFWVEESAAASAGASPQQGNQDSTQQLPPAALGQPSQSSGHGSTAVPAQGQGQGHEPTQQLPSQGFGVPGGGFSQDPPYSTAPAPYSGEPTAQLPYSTDPTAFGGSPPSYAAGGFAGQGGQGGFGPGGPGGPSGPGDPGQKKSNVGILIAIIGGVALILIVGGILLWNSLRGGDEPEPTATETSQTSEPTTDPTTADPTDDPTTDEPTEDPTTDEPADPAPPAGGAPVGTVETAIGAPYEVTDFDDALEATITLQEMAWDPECTSSFGSDAEGRLIALRFDVTVANPTPSGDAFTLNDFYFNAYSDAANTGTSWSFCDIADMLPSDIQPGASAGGWVVVDVLEGSTWLTYEPVFGMGGDGAAWRLPS